MNLEQLIAEFRNRAQDLQRPYLWSDEEIAVYANEAEEEACRRAHLLVDSSSDIVKADVYAGEPLVKLDERIIAVRRARMSDSSLPLVPRLTRFMDDAYPGWDASSTTGVPRIFIPDWETGKLRLHQMPSVNGTLLLTAVRLPEKPMEDAEDKPEIKARDHMALVDGMLARAYAKPDADSFDDKKAAAHEAAFTRAFGPAVSSLDENWALQQYYDVGEL